MSSEFTFATEKLTLPRGPTLVPATPQDLEYLEQLPLKTRMETKVEPSLDRTAKLRRWYWGLMTIVAEAHGLNRHRLSDQIKEDLDFIQHVLPSGTKVFRSIATGISYVDMRDYVQRAKDQVFIKWLYDNSAAERNDVLKRVEEWTGEPCPF